jgi:ubiquinol oxidase
MEKTSRHVVLAQMCDVFRHLFSSKEIRMVVLFCARLCACFPTTARSGAPERDSNARRRSHSRKFCIARAATTRRTRTTSKADANAEQPPFPTAKRKTSTSITNPAAYTTLSVIRKRAGDYVDSPQIVGVPSSALKMAERHFVAELKALIREAFVLNKKEIAKDEKERTGVTKYSMSETFDSSSDFGEEFEDQSLEEEIERQGELLLEYLERMKLSNAKIWEREKRLPKVESPWIIEGPYYLLCKVLDLWFPENKPVQRFWFLETVARMPYFSYTTMLTLYELLGWWRRSSELRKVHFAEEWNEYHHLLIMESLGGDRRWSDRFLAQHAALVYYFGLVVVWLLSPKLAYNFSEKIETHAVATYAQFTEENKELLESLPAPEVAKKYYEAEDLYLFDEFQTTTMLNTGEIVSLKLNSRSSDEGDPLDPLSVRRPKIETLYDVFSNICEDEKEHVGTMNACQIEGVTLGTANTINALTALAIGGTVASKFASRFAEESAITDGLDDIIGSGKFMDLFTALTDFFSVFHLPFF